MSPDARRGGRADPRVVHLVPAGALRCIWMTAGLVVYKLCDRGYECDGCPFDACMHGGGEPAAAAQPERAGPETGELREDRAYAGTHVWARAHPGGPLRVGLDAFAARLIGRPQSIIVPPPGSPLARGEAGCWLVDEVGPVPVVMPVSGTMRRGNPRLRDRPCLASDEPYDRGWLLEAECDDAEGELANLFTAKEMRRRTEADRQEMSRRAAALLRRGAGDVGPTLADGGRPVEDLRDLLGARRYRELVLSLLR